jgi:hypothetical protein
MLLIFIFSRTEYTRFVAHEHHGDPHGQPAYQHARLDVRFHEQLKDRLPRRSKELKIHILNKQMP